MNGRDAGVDPRLGLVGGGALLVLGLWLLLGRPGLSGIGVTAAGVLITGWSLQQLLAARR